MRRFVMLLAVLSCRDPSASTAPAASSVHVPVPVPEPDSAFTPERVWGEGKAMGTHISFAAYTTPAVDPKKAHAAFDDAIAEIKRLETLMTTWRDDSEVSRIN